MSSTLSRPPQMPSNIHRVAILFAGGPAPAANAVISTAAVSFLRNNIDAIGILHGYSHLMEYAPDHQLVENRDYIRINQTVLKRTRNSQGILIGTARANPGKDISEPAHLKDPNRAKPLKTVYDALLSIGVDALISIGGDDTLKSANKFKLFQEQLPPGSKRIPVVHLPKTIDNDYSGIDFTFGYFTAVDVLAEEIRNLLADAEAGRAYYIAETMGRSAGWLSYGAAIAGEASLVISVEDITGKYEMSEEITDSITGKTTLRRVMDMKEVVNRIVATMRAREEVEGKEFGVIVMAEGLAEFLPNKHIEGVPRDEHGHIAIAKLNLSRLFADLVAKEYTKQTSKKRKITGLQLGYESRCARPQAFDVMLGSQLGVGAYRALVEKRLDGVMVSVSGQLELNYVPFSQLVDPATLVTVVRYIEPNSDFHQLARFLETFVND
jgi:ATP-dependent phosphofructokinase / diphosphate-dependent phosphofructokinase